jgi:hypothetical protein
MVADMDGLGSLGSSCRGLWVHHGQKPSMRISAIPLRPK